jgi:hypothetical protein
MRLLILLSLSIVFGIALTSCQQQASQQLPNDNKMAAASPEAPKKAGTAYDAEAVANRGDAGCRRERERRRVHQWRRS